MSTNDVNRDELSRRIAMYASAACTVAYGEGRESGPPVAPIDLPMFKHEADTAWLLLQDALSRLYSTDDDPTQEQPR